MDSSFTQTNIRMLAAIMFTDMVGYTKLMQNDESLAKQKRDLQRNVLETEISNFQGRILQYYGDGTLSIFGSAVQAVKSAVAIQSKLLVEHNIPVRIGIHIGDIATDESGVFGDGVNVAARVQALGVEGSILISGKVYDEIRNHSDISSLFLGAFQLKNVVQQTNIYAITNSGIIVPSSIELEKKSAETFKSIAVLPFVNMSTDSENEYFSDGISEEILNTLAHVDGLRVTSRTSSFAFKNKVDDIRKIAETLNVSTVLEGSVRKHNNRVRVTAQLINAEDGYHIWSDTYDRQLEDIFQVQDEIAQTIVDKLKEKLVIQNSEPKLSTKPTDNIEAYNLYLKGLFYWNRFTPNSIKKAIELFERAILLEPSFSHVHAKISGSYAYLGAIGAVLPSIAYPKAKEYAEKALLIDETNEDAHLAMAMFKMFYNWDWDGSYLHFNRALELNPNSTDVLYNIGFYYFFKNNIPQAIEFVEAALMIDPLSPNVCSWLANLYLNAGEFDKSISHFKKTLRIDSEYRTALYGLGMAYFQKGETEKAISILKEAQSKTKSNYKGLTQLGFVYSKIGRYKEAEEIIELLHKREIENPDEVLDLDFALIYLGLNQKDKMYNRLEHALELKLGGILFLRGPIWKELESDSRYQAILRKINL